MIYFAQRRSATSLVSNEPVFLSYAPPPLLTAHDRPGLYPSIAPSWASTPCQQSNQS